MKDEGSGKMMKEVATLRGKTYSYPIDNKDEDKKTKGTKNCVIKGKFKFKDYKNVKSNSI